MFYGFVITEAGNRLLAQMVAGQTLALSRVVMDKGTADSAEAARRLAAPIEPGPAGTSTVPSVEGSTVSLTVEYRSDLNGGLSEGFWIGGFGIFAKNPAGGDDVMIYYGSLGDARQYVSAYAPGTAPDVRRYPVSITVTEGVAVTVTCPAEAWMTAQEVAEYVERTLRPALLNQVIRLGGEIPQGPALWLDTRPRGQAEPVLLELGEAGGDAQICVALDGTDYPAQNAALNAVPSEGMYNFDLL